MEFAAGHSHLRIAVLCLFLAVLLPRFADAESLFDSYSPDQKPLLLSLATRDGRQVRPDRLPATDLPLIHVSITSPNPALFLYDSRHEENTREDVLREWNSYVGDKIERYRTLIEPDFTFCKEQMCNPDSIDRSADKKWIEKMAVKETVHFTMKKEPWIESFVRFTTLQFRHNATKSVSLQSVKDAGLQDTSGLSRKKNNEFSFKGGLKTNFIDGSIGFVAEAQARYRTLTTFYRFDLSKSINIVGMEYPLGGGMVMQYRHESTHSSGEADGFAVAGSGAFQSLRLIYQF